MLLGVQLSQLCLVGRHFLSHHTRRVPPKALPFSRQLAALLSVIVQETAEIAQLLVVITESLVCIFETSQLCSHSASLYVQNTI